MEEINSIDNFQNNNNRSNIDNKTQSSQLIGKYDMKFYNLCQLFESCSKGKTKSKVK